MESISLSKESGRWTVSASTAIEGLHVPTVTIRALEDACDALKREVQKRRKLAFKVKR